MVAEDLIPTARILIATQIEISGGRWNVIQTLGGRELHVVIMVVIRGCAGMR